MLCICDAYSGDWSFSKVLVDIAFCVVLWPSWILRFPVQGFGGNGEDGGGGRVGSWGMCVCV